MRYSLFETFNTDPHSKFMKILPISSGGVTSVYTEFFSQPVIRSSSTSQKSRFLVNPLEPKDIVTISQEAKTLSILRQQSQYEAIANPLQGQPPVVAIPEQRNPESPVPTYEPPKTLPIAPVPPLQNPEPKYNPAP